MPETSHLTWRKSSYSGSTTQNCVEVAETADVLVRDSKNPEQTCLRFDRAAWAAFVAAVSHQS